MKTTVTLDSDVEKLLRELMQREHKTFEQALNDTLRRGLKGERATSAPAFEISARPPGLREGIDPARLHDLDAELEIDEFFRKTRALREEASS